jgi:DNA polymerase-3 subunit epsilon
MRQVVLDTETTGLEVAEGHRIIEIGCVELVNRRRTGRTYHQYVNPEREIDSAAEAVHGISRAMLATRPRFAEVVEPLLEFLCDAELVIHNAEFDLGFLRREVQSCGRDAEEFGRRCPVVDSLVLARRLHPGQRNGLDALCKRYAVDNSGREYHGALLDAQLLTDVYLAMTGGQATLSLDSADAVKGGQRETETQFRFDRGGLELTVLKATPDELAAHEELLKLLDKSCPDKALWRALDA